MSWKGDECRFVVQWWLWWSGCSSKFGSPQWRRFLNELLEIDERHIVFSNDEDVGDQKSRPEGNVEVLKGEDAQT